MKPRSRFFLQACFWGGLCATQIAEATTPPENGLEELEAQALQVTSAVSAPVIEFLGVGEMLTPAPQVYSQEKGHTLPSHIILVEEHYETVQAAFVRLSLGGQDFQELSVRMPLTSPGLSETAEGVPILPVRLHLMHAPETTAQQKAEKRAFLGRCAEADSTFTKRLIDGLLEVEEAHFSSTDALTASSAESSAVQSSAAQGADAAAGGGV